MGQDLGRILAERRTPMAAIDAGRMRRERHTRLRAEMARQGIEVAVLLHGPNVAYATGRAVRGIDVSHAVFERPVALVVAGEDTPHLLAEDIDPTPDVECHPAVWPELDEGAEGLARVVAEIAGPLGGRRVAVDEQSGAMLRAGVLEGAAISDASHLVGAAKLTKTDDELACIAEAQRRNEEAMAATQETARTGATRSKVAGAFLAQLVELGVEANLIDPIFQPMPRSLADGPRTTTETVAFPTGVDDPTFAEGDIVWVDTGIDHLGYASDFGRTWVVGRDPNTAEVRLFERWSEVMVSVLEVLKPGATGGDLCRAAEAANFGERPWLPHFYLAHGVGVESAEMPLVGTDLGPEFDESLVMAPGMVLVLEPVIWEDGVGSYRAEEIVAVTQDGWRHLGGGHPYPPFA
ncbi:MAG TPA: Xaa-Pro peptidase family protein [Acidimicrobiales bacterium]|nr:Xaa-Pro peptidase family protein [Acidimicrobiales bacterium]